MDDTDLARRLDRSIGPAPDSEPPLADLLAAGHHVVRRRRIAAGAGTALAAAAVFVVVAISTSGSPQRAEAPIATQPTATPTPSPTPPPTPVASEPSRREISKVIKKNLVHYDGQCRLVVDQGTIVRQLADPYDLAATGGTSSVGEVQVGTGLYWYASTCDTRGGESGAWIWSGDARTSFEGWVQDNVPTPESAGGDSGGPFIGIPDLDLVRFEGASATLVPEASVTIFDQRSGVDLGSGFAGPGERTAAAQVSDASGAVYFVLARSIDGAEPQYITVPDAAVDGGDLDDFLDLARTRYAEGGGGLL